MSISVKISSPSREWIATIKHEFENDRHIFTSFELADLLIKHRDREHAISRIAPAIVALIAYNYGETATVELLSD